MNGIALSPSIALDDIKRPDAIRVGIRLMFLQIGKISIVLEEKRNKQQMKISFQVLLKLSLNGLQLMLRSKRDG